MVKKRNFKYLKPTRDACLLFLSLKKALVAMKEALALFKNNKSIFDRLVFEEIFDFNNSLHRVGVRERH